jgi:hypothetical protein
MSMEPWPLDSTKRSRLGQAGFAGLWLRKIVPQHLGYIRHAHRRAGMAAVGLLDRIHGEGADGVGEFSSAGHAFRSGAA